MIIAGLVFAALAAALHVYIFALESLWWMRPRTRGVFGVSVEEAGATREFAFNQGFYNLFLALMVIVGCVLVPRIPAAGYALVFAGTGSMLAAALVLSSRGKRRRRAAFAQGCLPLVALVLLIAGRVG